jgi:uncharacterized protein DUF3310
MPLPLSLENSMLDNSNLKEPFDVSTLEEEVSSLVGKRGTESYASPLRRTFARKDSRLPEPRLENDTEMAEPTGAEDAGEDTVNHPKHYNVHPSGIECIVISRWMNFNLGNVLKYIWRCDTKGATIEDLKKARWYLDDEITRLEKLVS